MLHNVEEHYYDAIKKTSRHVATIAWQKPYALALSLKRLEELKNKPKGTYYKITNPNKNDTKNKK